MHHASRHFLRSRAVGVDFLAGMVASSADSSNDKQHIHGYKKFSSKDTDLTFIAAAVGLIPLAWHQRELPIDDRFFLRAEPLKAGLLQRVEEVSQLPDFFGHGWRGSAPSPDRPRHGKSGTSRLNACIRAMGT